MNARMIRVVWVVNVIIQREASPVNASTDSNPPQKYPSAAVSWRYLFSSWYLLYIVDENIL